MHDDKIIREYVRSLLREDIYDYGSEDALKKIFVDPFTKAGTVIKGEINKMGASLALAVKSVVTAAFSLVGSRWVPDMLKKMNKKASERISEIDKDPEYATALKDVSAIASKGAQKILFMSNPAAFLTAASVVKAQPVQTFLATMSYLKADGFFDDFWIEIARARDKRHRDTTSERALKYLMKMSKEDIAAMKESKNLIGEADVDVEEYARIFLSDPKVVNAIKQSEMQKKMPKEISKLAEEIGNEYVTQAKSIAMSSTLDDLLKKVGASDIIKDASKLTSQDAKDTALETLKIKILQTIADSMQTHLENLDMAEGDNLYKRKILEAAKKVASLAS